MNINIKDCKESIITDTDTLEITGKPQSVIKAAEGVISTQRTYTIEGFKANRDKVQIGDRVKLPAFTVPAVEMVGDRVMKFIERQIPADEAIFIGKDEKGNFILIFSHCLFESAIDLNNEKSFKKTQLGQYLQGVFLRAMNGAGIPAESCGLISKEEMFSDNPLEYFKKGHNRMTFDFDEDLSRRYWLSTWYGKEESDSYFCCANDHGFRSYSDASGAVCCVRPRFLISAI